MLIVFICWFVCDFSHGGVYVTFYMRGGGDSGEINETYEKKKFNGIYNTIKKVSLVYEKNHFSWILRNQNSKVLLRLYIFMQLYKIFTMDCWIYITNTYYTYVGTLILKIK